MPKYQCPECEAILKREVNAGVHAELLGRLKAEL